MRLIRLILREARYAWLNTLLSLAVVALAAGLLTAMSAFSRASQEVARVAMKDLGFNMLIYPAADDPARFQMLDFQEATMPEEYVNRLVKETKIVTHYVGKLQKTIDVDGRRLVLTGIAREIPSLARGPLEVMPAAYVVPAGDAFLGASAARLLGAGEGASVTLLGKAFKVARVLPETGLTPDDIRIFVDIREAQTLLALPGRINAIDAMSCMCPVPDKDLVATVRRDVREVLPDVEAQAYPSIMLARHRMRRMIALLASATLAIVMAGAALAVWGLTYQSVRNRRREIGVLRALGVPGWRIAALFAGKILVYGLLGAVAGYYAGVAVAGHLELIDAPAKAPRNLLPQLALMAPLAALLFGAGPIATALFAEPANLLRDDRG